MHRDEKVDQGVRTSCDFKRYTNANAIVNPRR